MFLMKSRILSLMTSTFSFILYRPFNIQISSIFSNYWSIYDINMVDIFVISIKISDKTRIGSGILTPFCPRIKGSIHCLEKQDVAVRKQEFKKLHSTNKIQVIIAVNNTETCIRICLVKGLGLLLPTAFSIFYF